MLWRMNIQVTRKKLSITNKSKGLQYVRELIVKGKKTMVNILKKVEQALRPYHFTVIQVYLNLTIVIYLVSLMMMINEWIQDFLNRNPV